MNSTFVISEPLRLPLAIAALLVLGVFFWRKISSYLDIPPLSDLDWKLTDPIKFRPFKPKYHLTMALEKCVISDFILVDNTYSNRIHLRRRIMEENQPEVIGCNDICGPAIREFYAWMMQIYLPRRFPTMFQIVRMRSGRPKLLNCDNTVLPEPYLLNIVVNGKIPLEAPESLKTTLAILASHVDTDILFLLPTQKDQNGQPIYTLQAFATLFPSGFNTRSKLGLPLAGVHQPVPGYKEKLESSMDRFFASLPVGKIVQRKNWSITTDEKLFCLSGNHITEEGEGQDDLANGVLGTQQQRKGWEEEASKVRPDASFMRCERQTLHRLPETGALVFAFKTYLYPLTDIKGEGRGKSLADAVEGLEGGSVPRMAVYKKAVVWGERVIEWLRA